MHILFRETACLSFHDVGKQGKHWPRCTSPLLEPSLVTLILTYNAPKTRFGRLSPERGESESGLLVY